MPALAHTPAPSRSTGSRLVSADGRALSFLGGTLSVDAVAGVACVTLRQRFVNPHAEPLRVTYTVPLPSDAAVSGFAFELSDQRIVGEVDTRSRARARFEEALIEGRTAALLEQDRSSLFTQEVGNIPPGEEVTCELVLDQRLRWRQGGWEWRFPTVVAPRYGSSAAHSQDAQPPSVPVSEAGTPARMALTLTIRDTLTGAVHSPSHALHVTSGASTTAGLRAESGAALDRDIVIGWPVAALQPGAHLEVGRTGQPEAGGLLTLVPPSRPMPPVPRDLIVLLDTSGSMGGAPLRQACAVTEALIESLGEGDQLQIVEFSTQPRAWRPSPVHMSQSSRQEAIRWVRSLRAGGGTEMRTGILAALGTIRDEAQRQVILVTDGLISFESEITHAILERLPRGSRVHTLGIGSSVNRTLLTSAARAGGGLELIIGISEEPDGVAAELVSATAAPQVVDVSLAGSALLAVDHHRIPDLMAERPVQVAVRLRPEGGTLVVHGHTAAGPWTQTISVPPTATQSGSLAVVKLVGRERVAELELRAAIGENVNDKVEAIGMAYQIATRLTSWIAVSTQETVDATAPTRQQTVPQALPHGMSAEGLGLRMPSPPSGHTSFFSAPAMLGPGTMEGAPSSAAPPRAPRFKEQRARGDAPSKDQAPRPVSEVVDDQDVYFGDLEDDSFSSPVPLTDENILLPPVRILWGRVLLAKGDLLVIEFDVDLVLDWSPPEQVLLWLADEPLLTLTLSTDMKRTTVAGLARAGLRLRIGVIWPEAEQRSGTIREVNMFLPNGVQLSILL